MSIAAIVAFVVGLAALGFLVGYYGSAWLELRTPLEDRSETAYLCDKGITLDDYAAKRYSDFWAARDGKPLVKAHYTRLKDEAYQELQNHIKSCDQCSAHMARIA